MRLVSKGAQALLNFVLAQDRPPTGVHGVGRFPSIRGRGSEDQSLPGGLRDRNGEVSRVAVGQLSEDEVPPTGSRAAPVREREASDLRATEGSLQLPSMTECG